MAAVLFAASADGFPSAGQEAKGGEREALKDALAALSAADAKAFLWKFARKYPDIAEQITLKATGRVTDA